MYCARWMKTLQKRSARTRNMTTTNRHGTKTSTTFSVFLLTGILQKLILRFADFGGNVVAPGPVFLFRGNDRLRNHVATKYQNKKNTTLAVPGCAVKRLP